MQLVILCLALLWPCTVLTDETPTALRNPDLENDIFQQGFDRALFLHNLREKHVLAYIIKAAAEDLLANEALQMKPYEGNDSPSESNVAVTEDDMEYETTRSSDGTDVSKRGNCPGDRCLRIKKKPKQTSSCSHNACLRILPFGKRALGSRGVQFKRPSSGSKTRSTSGGGGGGRTNLRPSFPFGKKDYE
ncbi:uncharacterized protein [Antedon mediterranea]|uniref:uncharacterized protein n=1 Tax=Antedon mediterranea TaxID=105859 RepID=UPI003AF5661D